MIHQNIGFNESSQKTSRKVMIPRAKRSPLLAPGTYHSTIEDFEFNPAKQTVFGIQPVVTGYFKVNGISLRKDFNTIIDEKSQLGQLVQAIRGYIPSDDEETFDIGALIGSECLIKVEDRFRQDGTGKYTYISEIRAVEITCTDGNDNETDEFEMSDNTESEEANNDSEYVPSSHLRKPDLKKPTIVKPTPPQPVKPGVKKSSIPLKSSPVNHTEE